MHRRGLTVPAVCPIPDLRGDDIDAGFGGPSTAGTPLNRQPFQGPSALRCVLRVHSVRLVLSVPILVSHARVFPCPCLCRWCDRRISSSYHFGLVRLFARFVFFLTHAVIYSTYHMQTNTRLEQTTHRRIRPIAEIVYHQSIYRFSVVFSIFVLLSLCR